MLTEKQLEWIRQQQIYMADEDSGDDYTPYTGPTGSGERAAPEVPDEKKQASESCRSSHRSERC